ncbi:MAG TPA: hypothetical protein VHM65_05225 [Candidatus Lustribacter sp.]|nr:hypothetical protein [Candidatus Lustribacter sp.]
MQIDCDRCPVRGTHCESCFVTALARLPVLALDPQDQALDPAEQRAVDLFVAAGLVAADEAAGLRARREPWRQASAV